MFGIMVPRGKYRTTPIGRNGTAGLPNLKFQPSRDLWVNIDPDLRFKDPLPLQLLDHWNEKRGTRRMASRRDFDPTELGPHLGNLILIDVEHAPLRLRYRLIGTFITNLMQRDNTGRYYDEIYGPELLEAIYESFRWILANRAPLRSHGEAFYPDKNFYSYEVINLPLSDDDDTVNMILGELIFHRMATP
jgi:hypothetical protein